ncbi:hypothetical protein M011DRAFT_479339 [Sporormia fimetaria CBS 119925]|uniref:Uncharacterized protein n=1 Tax=Sporormia fimetaria CBS 119925 TaxID=1340428 RepID=A0A6A6V3N6_9PLEO|nr:hypothetical protein M011DRAFT_479339 [Sporormia fimetaria CBS 119925]
MRLLRNFGAVVATVATVTAANASGETERGLGLVNKDLPSDAPVLQARHDCPSGCMPKMCVDMATLKGTETFLTYICSPTPTPTSARSTVVVTITEYTTVTPPTSKTDGVKTSKATSVAMSAPPSSTTTESTTTISITIATTVTLRRTTVVVQPSTSALWHNTTLTSTVHYVSPTSSQALGWNKTTTTPIVVLSTGQLVLSSSQAPGWNETMTLPTVALSTGIHATGNWSLSYSVKPTNTAESSALNSTAHTSTTSIAISSQLPPYKNSTTVAPETSTFGDSVPLSTAPTLKSPPEIIRPGKPRLPKVIGPLRSSMIIFHPPHSNTTSHHVSATSTTTISEVLNVYPVPATEVEQTKTQTAEMMTQATSASAVSAVPPPMLKARHEPHEDHVNVTTTSTVTAFATGTSTVVEMSALESITGSSGWNTTANATTTTSTISTSVEGTKASTKTSTKTVVHSHSSTHEGQDRSATRTPSPTASSASVSVMEMWSFVYGLGGLLMGLMVVFL